MRKGAPLVSLFFLLLILSCNSGDKKITKLPPVPRELNNINFFLETSASMEGYLRGNSDFAKVIPNLLVDIEGRIKCKKSIISINYIADSIRKYSGSTRDFIHDISTTQVAVGNSSQMHKIVEAVTNATDSNDISILVSDCILSYSDADIKKNPEINVQKADGELKADVKQAFLKMKKRGVCATVYGFSSRFYGTYYTYQNGKILLNGEVSRPYYIWVIGNKELLQRFNKELSEIEAFKPELAISFGIFDAPINDYTLLFKTGKRGEWVFDDNSLTEVSATKKSPIKFSIAVDFSSLPNYAKDSGYLRANLKLLHPDLDARLASINEAVEIDLGKAAPKEKAPLQNATHVISFEVNELYQSKGSVTLQLPLRYDTSYRNWSVMDDKNVKMIGKRTFAFEHLVNGVREAYQNNNENFINITINLKK